VPVSQAFALELRQNTASCVRTHAIMGGGRKEKREIEDQLAGRTPEPKPEQEHRALQDCIDIFIRDKKNQGVTEKVIRKYTRELARLRTYCEQNRVYAVQVITLELLTGFCAVWPELYPSSYTRAKVRARPVLRPLRYEAQWIPRIPALPKIKIDGPPTLPLTGDEYTRLLAAVYGTVADSAQRARVHALLQLMRWSGLAIRDALTLKRAGLQFDEKKQLHRIVTARQKTGVNVSGPIPRDIAQELLSVANGTRNTSSGAAKGNRKASRKIGPSITLPTSVEERQSKSPGRTGDTDSLPACRSGEL
jgi:integrase/recombinase XerD